MPALTRSQRRRILAEIEGAYAFAAMAKDYPDQLIVARNASPLAVGIGDAACYIGSDAIARRILHAR